MADTTVTRRSDDDRVTALLAGEQWDEATISFSFPQTPSDYGSFAGAFPEAGMEPVGAIQQTMFRDLFAPTAAGSDAFQPFSVEGLTGLDIAFAGNGGQGDIRIARNGTIPTSFTYTPSAHPLGGDLWLGQSGTDPEVGNYHYHTLIHELGHALGLKHPHEGMKLDLAWDGPEYTVMSYRPHAGSDRLNYRYERFGAPQTFMLLDIAALQHMYGADYGTNAGDTVYAWDPETGAMTIDGERALTPGGNRIFATLWDGNGTDSYDLANYTTDLRLDLSPGAASTFSQAQLADLGEDVMASGNLYNALLFDGDKRSLIENAIGGSGDDRISGNSADNRLEGGSGDDRLSGGSGRDRLIGGSGNDRLDGGGGNDRLEGGSGNDRLDGGKGKDRLSGNAGDDTLQGGGGADDLGGGQGRDKLSGGKGADTLKGNGGSDRLDGGKGADKLVGGSGDDHFVFRSDGDSTSARPDRIAAGGGAAAFEGAGKPGGDVIDLRAIDADRAAEGKQSFAFDGGQGIGHVWLDTSDGDTRVMANTRGGSEPDFVLIIADGEVSHRAYSAEDFLL